jgi:hypothetical protein
MNKKIWINEKLGLTPRIYEKLFCLYGVCFNLAREGRFFFVVKGLVSIG